MYSLHIIAKEAMDNSYSRFNLKGNGSFIANSYKNACFTLEKFH